MNNFEPKKVKDITSIRGSKYSCKSGLVFIEIIKKYNKIKLFLKFLSIKINIIIQEIKNEK